MKNNIKIKNIVFDIGNVIVRWEPYGVIKLNFPEDNPQEFFNKIRPVWLDLNLGKINEKEAIIIISKQLNISQIKMTKLFNELIRHQILIPESIELLKKLNMLGFHLYSITDNVREIMQHHRDNSNFLSYFKGIIASCDIGILKPDERIFKELLNRYQLDPAESIFIDDIEANVKGAKAIGMQAFQFIDTKSCIEDLIRYGINL